MLGALFAVGSVIAAMFELQGFGTDADPRTWYLLLVAGGFVVSVTVPIALWRVLLPRSSPSWALAAIPAVAAVLVVLGISLSR